MKKALILFNGIRLPHHLTDRALDWAATNKAEVTGVFVKAGSESSETYAFPSDINFANEAGSDSKAALNDKEMIERNSHLFCTFAHAKDLSCETFILTEPSLDKVLQLAGNTDIIFISDEFDGQVKYSSHVFTTEDLQKENGIEIEIVSEAHS